MKQTGKKRLFLGYLSDNSLITATTMLGILLLVLSFIYKPLALFGYLLVFNGFDLFGYRDCAEGIRHNYNYRTVAYRIDQTLFQLFLLAFIWTAYGWQYAVLGEALHWFGWQDILYYLIGNYRLSKTWSWLGWTPLGIIKKKPLTKNEVVLQAIAGLGLVVGILYYF